MRRETDQHLQATGNNRQLKPNKLFVTLIDTTILLLARASSKMNFRDYASRIRTHAQEAVSKIEIPKKLPTFDDMAAKDEYIHSDDFNVPGTHHRQSQYQGTVATVSARINEPDPSSSDGLGEASSAGSWSLLTQPSQHSSVDQRQGLYSTATNDDDFQHQHNTTSDSNAALGSFPVMLSVVADTLSEHGSNLNSAATSLRGEDDEDLGASFGAGFNSDDSENDDDQDDPIMLLMQQERDPSSSQVGPKSNGRQKRTTKCKKPQHRFIEDLERRINTPQPAPQTMLAEGAVNATTEAPPSSQGRMKLFFQKMTNASNIGGWARNARSPTMKAPAPLDLPRNTQKSSIQSDEGHYTTVASSAILSEEERANLATRDCFTANVVFTGCCPSREIASKEL